MSDGLLDTIPAVLVLSAPQGIIACIVLVQLQSCLDHPDRIRGRSSSNSRGCRGEEVHSPYILSPFRIEVVVEDSFAVPIHEEVDAPGRYDTNQVCTETAKERPEAFMLIYRVE